MSIVRQTDYKLPTREYQDDNSGSVEWSFIENVEEDATTYAISNFFTVGLDPPATIDQVYLLFDDTLGATNKSSGEDATATRIYGGASDQWGLSSPVGSDFNNNKFGIMVSFAEGGAATYELRMQGFEFSDLVPDDATIDGITVEVQADSYAGGGGTVGYGLDTVRVRIDYTWNPTVIAQGEAVGICYVDPPRKKEKRKKYRYRVTDADGIYVGDWRDVKDDPQFTKEINNGLTSMTVQFARNEQLTEKIVETLATEADEDITTEDGEVLAFDTISPIGVGAGTDLDLNYNLQLDAFYGEHVALLTEAGEPIYTESGDLLLVQNGRPEGRPILTGYVAQWELGFGEDDTTATIFSHSHELKNIMLETFDTVLESFETHDGYSTNGIAGFGPTDNFGLAQTFQASSTGSISRISLLARRWNSPVSVTLTLKTGNTLGSGTVLATSTVDIPNALDTDLLELNFPFDEYVDLTSGSDYHFELETTSYKSGGGAIYPAQFAFNYDGGYANGSGYYIQKTGSWTALTGDFWFRVWEAGGETEVAFNSKDPAYIMQEIARFAQSRGARVQYSNETVEPTGTLVSYTFNTNTCYEAMEKVLELCPTDWYWHYDFGTNEVHLHPRPDTASRQFTLGRNIAKMQLKRSIENIVNEVYFTGGVSDISAGDDALFVKTTDATSQDSWRRGLAKLSDQRVKDATTATTLSQSEIDRFKDPEYTAVLDFIGVDEFIEDVDLGELNDFAAFNSFVDDLELQTVRINYRPDTLTLTLETLLPQINKRIEDIQRNLDQKEREFNPSTPS